MAISWEVKVTVTSIATTAVRVVATRTDSASPDNPEVIMIDGVIATAGQKQALLDAIWAKHLILATWRAKADAAVGGLEAQAKTNLESREL